MILPDLVRGISMTAMTFAGILRWYQFWRTCWRIRCEIVVQRLAVAKNDEKTTRVSSSHSWPRAASTTSMNCSTWR